MQKLPNIHIEEVEASQKTLLFKLLQLYLYEFTDYTNDDLNESGAYDYDYFDSYFIEKSRFPYFIHMDDQLVGFCLINQHSLLGNVGVYSVA